MKKSTTTETYSKSLARSGPDLRPNQILLDKDNAKRVGIDPESVSTQSDLNAALANGGGGGGGGGGGDINLDGYATTEQLTQEAHARETGDKANQAGITQANKAIQENEKDIESLGSAFDTAVIAAQEGAENLEIELQTYAKKTDTYTKTETDATFAKKTDIPDAPGEINLDGYATTEALEQEAEDRDTGDKALLGLIEAKPSTGDLSKYAKLNGADFTGDVKMKKGNKIKCQNDKDNEVIRLDSSNGQVTAVEFIGDGSKLTNLPGGAVGISEVLAEGDTADPYQTLSFKLESGNIPEIPYLKEIIEIDGGSGFRLGSLVSYMTMNEPFSINTAPSPFGLDIEVTEFQKATRRMSAADDYYYSTNDRGDLFAGFGLTGLNYRDGGVYARFSGSEIRLRFEDPNDRSAPPFLDIDASKYNNKATIYCQGINSDKYIAGQDFRNGDLSDVGVEIDGEKGIIHLKGKNNTVTPIEVFQSGSNVHNTGSTVFKVDNHGVCTAEGFVGDGSKLTNLPSATCGLPGYKWNLVNAHALPPNPGEAMWVDGDNALYLHASTADGMALGNATTTFGQYDINGTAIVSAYKQGTGVEAIFKAMSVEMITQSGQTFWKIVKVNHARFNLTEGNAYNFTASGLF